MGRIKLKVREYDKEKAKKYFVWYKFLELFGLFLFFIGFYGLGFFVYNKYCGLAKWLMPDIIGTYLDLWTLGFLIFILVLGFLACLWFVIKMIYELIKMWVEMNWKMAKRKSETPQSKKKREEEETKLELYLEIEETKKHKSLPTKPKLSDELKEKIKEFKNGKK